jgi:hypothetical protein
VKTVVWYHADVENGPAHWQATTFEGEDVVDGGALHYVNGGNSAKIIAEHPAHGVLQEAIEAYRNKFGYDNHEMVIDYDSVHRAHVAGVI